MPYTHPDMVISPHGRLKNLKVIYDGGEEGWSLAEMKWDGKDALGIRWNGGPQTGVGNPQSRGIPTWFILPDAVATLIQENLKIFTHSASANKSTYS